MKIVFIMGLVAIIVAIGVLKENSCHGFWG